MKPPRNRKPTVSNNKQLGKLINKSIEQNSIEIKNSSSAMVKHSTVLLDSIKQAISSEKGNLSTIEEQLNLLNKSSASYSENYKILNALKNESLAKIDHFVSMSNNMDISARLTEKLINDMGKTSSSSDLLETQADKLKQDRIDKIKSDEQSKLNKQFKKIDNKAQFGKSTGLHEGITNILATSILGPLGKPIADALNLSDKLFNPEKKKEKLREKSELRIQKLLDKLEQDSTVSKEDKKLIESRYQENKENRELEEDRTQDYRSKSLALQSELLKKQSEDHLGIAKIISILVAGKVASLLGSGAPSLINKALRFAPLAFAATAINESIVQPAIRRDSFGNLQNKWDSFRNENIDKHNLAKMSPEKRQAELERRKVFKSNKESANRLQHEKDFGLANKQLEEIDNLPLVTFAKQNADSSVLNNYNNTIRNISNSTLTRATTSLNSLLSNDIVSNIVNSYTQQTGSSVKSYPMPSLTGSGVPIPMANKVPQNASNAAPQQSSSVNIDQIQPVIDDSGLTAVNLQTIGK